ncbi:VanZ family protein [Flavobacterium suaedae]|nr:VanZ family protein [Flavobacterium suaedae]
MRNIYFWAAITWTVLITVLCLVSMEKLGSVNNFKIPYKDKYGHFAFYFVFTLLWATYLKTKFRINPKKARVNALLAAVIYGTFIEVLQGLFTNGKRQSDFLDVVFNTLGGLVAVLVLWLLHRDKKIK